MKKMPGGGVLCSVLVLMGMSPFLVRAARIVWYGRYAFNFLFLGDMYLDMSAEVVLSTKGDSVGIFVFFRYLLLAFWASFM